MCVVLIAPGFLTVPVAQRLNSGGGNGEGGAHHSWAGDSVVPSFWLSLGNSEGVAVSPYPRPSVQGAARMAQTLALLSL